MGNSSVITSTNTFSLAVHILSPICGTVTGILETVQAEGSDMIASFGCRCRHCGGPETIRVALPGNLELPVGERISITRYRERYIVRRLEA